MRCTRESRVVTAHCAVRITYIILHFSIDWRGKTYYTFHVNVTNF